MTMFTVGLGTLEIDVSALAKAIAVELRRLADEGNANEGSEGEAPADASEPGQPARRRRARRSASKDDVGEPASDPEPKPRRSRKRAAATVASSDGDEKPTQRVRRRRNTGGAESESGGSSGAEEKPARRSRRSKAEPTEPSAEDLAKAASEGARHLTPAGVMAILSELKAEGIGDLEGSNKQDFIDRVNEEIDAATS